jgi:hypothetical protein
MIEVSKMKFSMIEVFRDRGLQDGERSAGWRHHDRGLQNGGQYGRCLQDGGQNVDVCRMEVSMIEVCSWRSAW